jgi:pimeloyl-ACP methyl ester carboxylesterase
VLVLASPGGAEPFTAGFLNALESRYRVIVPEPPPDAEDLAGWIANFLEGMGIARVRILAADRLCVAALELALVDPDQVACLVLHGEGPGAVADAGGALGAHGSGGRVPLLIVHGGPTAELLSRIDAFLAAEGVASHA